MEKISNDSFQSLDSVVKGVIMKFVERANVGKKKYGTDLDRQDLSVTDWISHAQNIYKEKFLIF